ncbi:hypothetical protein FNF27_06216 [Cafeteria roenbergensis]|uniref:Uncharacterized protein n=1 Tax=Cafeteria roenbergensis TaxID=33653 RepID=A0A5A8C6F3_CAFRO|nr:hypothetical protein FNF29_07205 [Cafeteria roenbergensis]KAA0151801.1 hypothetical protein FNF31_06752 [Cafeteria roenbergensis]KAA0171947.1 hypothetical protein FNF27_06216 [Cafeteria roenbergensis]|mmetsp:Transcript_13228/g.50664  ORF Transcript_13228/g.50664 Transcript_13228/m.50664 type:complete len:234 (-) Transcript_13228:135-836(-)|eukprot:KAA0147650.1 hypothetical protein FNF29_07205 [Cafeteria roenbergensis]
MDVPVIKGKLRMKGVSASAESRSKKRRRPSSKSKPAVPQGASEPSAKRQAAPAAAAAASEPAAPPQAARRPKESATAERREAIEGSGRIVSSGQTVTGTGTAFVKELRAGDALEIVDPVTAKQELRVVTMVLSDTAAGLSAPFPHGLAEPTRFRVLRIRAAEPAGERSAGGASAESAAADTSFAGEYSAAAGKLTWREKVGGSYRERSQGAAPGMSREAMLEFRAKKKHDKHC